MVVGALSPWARTFGGRVDGSQDELVLVLAIVAAVVLVLLAASGRRWLALMPLLAGLTAAALTGTPQVSGRFVSVEWGIFLALFGSTSFVLASVLLLVKPAPRRAGPAPTRWLWAAGNLNAVDQLSSRLRGVRERQRLGRRAAAARAVKRATRAAEKQETKRRRSFVEDASRITPHVSVERHGTLFFLPTSKRDGVNRFAKQEWTENRHLQRALDALESFGVEVPRKMFLDVGAHIGTTALIAVRRFGFESGVAFEPDQSNFRLLRANLSVNGLEQEIETFNVALSNRIGEGEFEVRPSIGSKHRVLRSDEVATNTVRVPLTTLDALVEGSRIDPADVSLLWLDIEGHELEALQGARALRERSIPIVMEFIPRELREGDRLEALASLLAEHYTHVVDLRPRPGGIPAFRPLHVLPELAEQYRRGFTDLLVFRLPDA
jgi:FkbM family methyltransferase